MFGHRYFGRRYFGNHYWGTGGASPPPPAVDIGGGRVHRARIRAHMEELVRQDDQDIRDIIQMVMPIIEGEQ